MYLLINRKCLIITEHIKRALPRLKKTNKKRNNYVYKRSIAAFNIDEINKTHPYIHNNTP